jgi:hypothetical protein
MQCQHAIGRPDILLDQRRFMSRQAVNYQVHRLGAVLHRLAQESDEQLTIQPTFVGREPEAARTFTAEAALIV